MPDTCEKQIRLDAYHDGELSPVERADVETHLRECPSCAAELAAMRGVTSAFAGARPPVPSDEQLLELARAICAAEPYDDARLLLRLFRVTAIAAALLLACAMAVALYLSQRTKAAAHEAMVLDHVTTWSRSAAAAVATGPVGDGRQSEAQVLLAQWIADDLRGRRVEER